MIRRLVKLLRRQPDPTVVVWCAPRFYAARCTACPDERGLSRLVGWAPTKQSAAAIAARHRRNHS